MTALSEDKVLRINCPGFGVSSILPLGEAKPLAMYDVIVVNPTSALHLFDNQSDAIKQIEMLQSDGMTSYRAETDSIIESITTEMDLRAQELQQFLKKGGLLIYFLTPPFTISGPSQALDNYSWLGEWAPDKAQPGNPRNMSATIRGKAIETTSDAAGSVWMPYLKQANIEWSTIIRFENLAECYLSLANAGPNKCIAGIRPTGHKNGQVVFLPAPYDQAYDGKLKQCIEKWFAAEGEGAVALAENAEVSLSALLSDEPEAPDAVIDEKLEEPAPAEEPVAESKPEFFDLDKAELDEPVAAAKPQAQDLINKMKNEICSAPVPEWCQKFSFGELDGLRTELVDVNEQIRQAQEKAQDLARRIETMESLKNALLSSQGEALAKACTVVFERLGWTVKPATEPGELWLLEGDTTQAIVRLNYSESQVNRSELASLAESVITYWGAHEVEPKGILLASAWADRAPNERPEEEFPEAMHEFARRKNLCLLTTAQLLSIYREVDNASSRDSDIRENLLTTSGRVENYQLQLKNSLAAAQVS